jgi:hypothetical protein
MDKARKKLFLEWIGFSCGLIVAFISGAGMIGKVNTPQLLGIIAGSFGAGAAMTSSIRDYADARAKKKKPGGEACAAAKP